MKPFPRRLALLFCVAASTCWGVESKESDEKISVDFQNETRLVIKRNVADLYELNLVVPENCPNDVVSMKLRNVTWREIFDASLGGTDFTYYSKGNVIRVVRVGDPDIEIAKAREKFEQEADENMRLRRAIKLLLGPDTRPLSQEKRNKILAIVADPNRPATELLATLYVE